jgi:hypothetical protein
VRFCAVKAICRQAMHQNHPILLITLVGRVCKRWMVLITLIGRVHRTPEEQISDHVQYIVLFDRLFSCFVPINI